MMLFTLIASVFLASCGCTLAQTGLSTSEKQNLVVTHNYFRSRVNPIATDMETTVWNSELAAVAQSYAERCIFGHNSDRSSQSQSFNYVGENLAITTSRNVNYTALVKSWYDEVADYDYNSNTCTGICGHYTQVVWADSSSIGCGAYRCGSTVGFNYPNSLNFVCNYGPGGNYVGQQPYQTGASSCSACPTDLPHCVANLCSATEGLPTVVGQNDFSGALPLFQLTSLVILLTAASVTTLL